MKKKKAFSLAEVLIAAGIISVIATMGFTATKKSTEKAYDLYIYNTYKSVCDSIADANATGYVLDNINNGDDLKDNDAVKHIIDLLAKPNTTPDFNVQGYYTFECANKVKIGINTNLVFRFEIPCARYMDSTGNTRETSVYLFYYNKDYNLLIPKKQTTQSKYDLANRKDILPFFIEEESDEIDINTGEYKRYRRVYRSFKEAFCLNKNSDRTLLKNDTFSCGISAAKDGFVRLGNPHHL